MCLIIFSYSIIFGKLSIKKVPPVTNLLKPRPSPDKLPKPNEKALFFEDVKGIEFGKTLRPILERQKSGGILLTIEIDDCTLANVQLDILFNLAESVKR